MSDTRMTDHRLIESATFRLRSLLGRTRDTGGLSPGDLAELRRADRILPPAFWQLLSNPEMQAAMNRLSHGDPEPTERAFAILIQSMIEAGPGGEISIGKALKQSGYAEQRFIQLLRARDDKLGDAARQAAKWCALKGVGLRFTDQRRNDGFGGFIIHAALSNEAMVERYAHAIARDYFSQDSETDNDAKDKGSNTP